MRKIETFRAGETGQDDSFFLPAVDFSGVIGMERVFVGCCGGNRFNVFNELALLCDGVFRVISRLCDGVFRSVSLTNSFCDSDIMFKPDRSENGKNVAKNSRIRPQNTVFCARENRFNKSLHMRSKLFLHAAKNQLSFHTDTLLST